MIRINDMDIKSLLFAIRLIDEVRTKSLSNDYRKLSANHIRRIRKVYLLLLDAGMQPNLAFSEKVQCGIVETSTLGKSITMLTKIL